MTIDGQVYSKNKAEKKKHIDYYNIKIYFKTASQNCRRDALLTINDDPLRHEATVLVLEYDVADVILGRRVRLLLTSKLKDIVEQLLDLLLPYPGIAALVDRYVEQQVITHDEITDAF